MQSANELTDLPSRNLPNKLIQKLEILLEAIIGDSYSITFGNGLVTVTLQPVTYDLSLLVFHYE